MYIGNLDLDLRLLHINFNNDLCGGNLDANFKGYLSYFYNDIGVTLDFFS